jgi:hypothetical protein
MKLFHTETVSRQTTYTVIYPTYVKNCCSSHSLLHTLHTPSVFLCVSLHQFYKYGKVKLSLCLINLVLCHEDVWRSGDIAPTFLSSALHGGEWSASRPGRFTPGKLVRGTHWIGD